MFKAVWIGVFSAHLVLITTIPIQDIDIISHFIFIITKASWSIIVFISIYFLIDFTFEKLDLDKKSKKKK